VGLNSRPVSGKPELAGAFLELGDISQTEIPAAADRVASRADSAREIRVIDEEGGQLGVMQPFEAIQAGEGKGARSREISPTADPPVCKITDYGKYLYSANKKAHEQRKSSRGSN